MANFNPSQITLGAGAAGKPYMPTGPSTGTPRQTFGQANQGNQPATLGAQAVRATGTGPFDNAYRQDLATYAGGFSQRPGGFLGFNPTGNIFGNPTGGGSDPVMGGPTDLLTAAIGGQGFNPQQKPQTGASTGTPRPPINGMNFWLDQFKSQGNPLRASF